MSENEKKGSVFLNGEQRHGLVCRLSFSFVSSALWNAAEQLTDDNASKSEKRLDELKALGRIGDDRYQFACTSIEEMRLLPDSEMLKVADEAFALACQQFESVPV